MKPAQHRPSFRAAYCAHVNCPREQYERHVFWRCIPAGRRLLSRLVLWLRPKHFDFDFELVRTVAKVTTLHDLEREVNLSVAGIRERNWLRSKLRLRMSLLKLRRVAAEVLPREAEAAVQPSSPMV